MIFIDACLLQGSWPILAFVIELSFNLMAILGHIAGFHSFIMDVVMLLVCQFYASA